MGNNVKRVLQLILYVRYITACVFDGDETDQFSLLN